MSLKPGTKGKRIGWFLVLGAVLLAVAVFFGGSQMAKGISVGSVDLNKINDGTYTGEATWNPVKVRVQVTVENHRMTRIDILEHTTGIGFRAEEPVRQSILDRQQPSVDHVSGATISSKIIMKAVENALKP